MSVGDLIGSLRNGKGKDVEGYLRDLARRYKEHDPEAERQIKKAAEGIIRAMPDDVFDEKMREIEVDCETLKRALEEAGGEEASEELDRDVHKGIKKKATKWAVREVMNNGGPVQDDLDKLREMVANGDEDERERAQEVLDELSAQGYDVS